MDTALGAAFSAIRLYTTGRGSEAAVYNAAFSVTSSIALGSAAPCRESDRTKHIDGKESTISDWVFENDTEILRDGLVAFATKPEVAETDTQECIEVTELFTWGKSANYQLGFVCTQPEQPLPRSVSKVTNIKMLSCGRFHSVAVATCGSVFAWGFGGTSSRLGFDTPEGSAQIVVEPVRLPEFGPGRHCAGKASAGLNHTMALTVYGKILTWGSNMHGQLGIQGTPIGSDARVRRPTVVKSALKGEEVVDIAAGAEHSICATSKGMVFAWGSNSGGGLGLGVPPSCPTEVAQPYQLPHLRGTYAVVAACTGHVSIALAAHGDAVIFGSPNQIDSNSRPGILSDAFYSPSRVRRRGQKDSQDEEDWQTQRSLSLPALQSVALNSEDAFGVDADGCLWTWTLRQRPCLAESVLVTSASSGTSLRGTSPKASNDSSSSASLPTEGWSAVASGNDAIWTIDRSPAASLWCLRRAPAAERKAREATQWLAERSEHVSQVSHITCSPEHTAALVKYKRPVPPSASCREVIAASGRSDDSGNEDSDEDAPLRRNQIYNPLSLQQLCENRLLHQLTPQSFTLAGEIAWEFRRPELLDCVYSFLLANTSLMFSRLNLPAIARLPLEVIAAFEMTASGAIACPSCALAIDPWDFPPPEWLQDSGADTNQLAAGMLELDNGSSCATHTAATQVRRRRRGGRGGDTTGGVANIPSSNTHKKPPPQSANLPPGASPVIFASSLSQQPMGSVSPLAPPSSKSPNFSGKHSPTMGAISEKTSPPLAPQVVADVSGNTAPTVGSPKSRAPKSAPKKKSAGFHMSDLLRPKAPTIAYGANVHAVDEGSPFGRGSAEISEGPSSTLVAAVQSASGSEKPQLETTEVHEKPSGWMRAETLAESSVSLRDVLAKVPKSQRRSAADNDPTGEKKRCSWGFDATPETLAQQGVSIADAQELDKRQKEDEEIEEIEAMFAALEASEIEAQFAALEATKRKDQPKPTRGATAPHSNKQRGKEEHRIATNGRGKGQRLGPDGKFDDSCSDTRKCDWHKNKTWNDHDWSGWWTSSQWWDSTTSNPEEKRASTGQGRNRGHRGRGRGKDDVGGENENFEIVAEASDPAVAALERSKTWRRKDDDRPNRSSTG